MNFHPDDVYRGCRTIVRSGGKGGWETGQNKKGFWAEYIHYSINDAGGKDFWSKGKIYFSTEFERDQFLNKKTEKGD